MLEIKDKVRRGIKKSEATISYLISLFISKEQQSLNFFKVNFLHLNNKYLFERLQEYWSEYRYFNEISQIIKLKNPLFKENKILDVGCGYTSVLNLLPKSERYGIDIVINGLKRNFSLSKEIRWINGTAENLPFENNFFDIVFCANGIDHFDNPRKALLEIKRVLKNKGLFILTVDVFKKEIGYRNKRHPYSYTESKLIKELSDFKILFKKKSVINAQFNRYIKNNIVVSEDKKELILVLQL
jgi:ubiquinone/menaquinone biosynthesis C-methylase UbiE